MVILLAQSCFVGQIVNLRRVGNPLPTVCTSQKAFARPSPGGLPIRRRLTTCPTYPSRVTRLCANTVS